MEIEGLARLAKTIRYYILTSTAKAGSGHPTSSLSAVELMTGLMFGGIFRFDPANPGLPNNDRLIFSKGHASPLFYAMWLAAGQVTEEEIMTYRSFGSPLEGHTTVRFRFTEASTGSLGQGLSIGAGYALNAKYLDKLPYRTYVLLGDSEMSEGSQWEAIQIAAHYKLDNLVGIIDVNRLGQRGETMYGWDVDAYRKRVEAFGWDAVCIDGHDLTQAIEAYRASEASSRPMMVIARTVKGKGVPFLENENGWHGKALEGEDLERALSGLGEVDTGARGEIKRPEDLRPPARAAAGAGRQHYEKGGMAATRDAYGEALKRIYPAFPEMVSLDGEVGNSTMAEEFEEARPERFFEMYIAEQNMVGTALGLAGRGKIPFVSTFAAFLSRAFDQVRMCQYSRPDIKFMGSHAGVSIGQDGPSQMGLEDIAMFRTLVDGTVLYPSDAVSMDALVEEAARLDGIVYLRGTRMKTPVIYDNGEGFPIGGCKVLRQSGRDSATVVGAGVTLHEALAAYDELKKTGTFIRVIDLYSVKPLDVETLSRAALETGQVITVEDHYAAGGLGEAVATALSSLGVPVHVMAVASMPMSGKPRELLDYEEISRAAIIERVRALHESAEVWRKKHRRRHGR